MATATEHDMNGYSEVQQSPTAPAKDNSTLEESQLESIISPAKAALLVGTEGGVKPTDQPMGEAPATPAASDPLNMSQLANQIQGLHIASDSPMQQPNHAEGQEVKLESPVSPDGPKTAAANEIDSTNQPSTLDEGQHPEAPQNIEQPVLDGVETTETPPKIETPILDNKNTPEAPENVQPPSPKVIESPLKPTPEEGKIAPRECSAEEAAILKDLNLADVKVPVPVNLQQSENEKASGNQEPAKSPSDSNQKVMIDDANDPALQTHSVKWIAWHEAKCPIITQNKNGPCPLLAIMNVLLLRGQVQLVEGVEFVTGQQLLSYIGDCILRLSPKDLPETVAQDYEQNVSDAMGVLNKLLTGLDVNVKFTGVSDFEWTPECLVFDLLNISLYHGWLVESDSEDITAAVGHNSYNQLVEKIVTGKSSADSALYSQALLAEQFLENSASQLTYQGLSELNQRMKDGELAVLFRNNHFSSLYKHKDELFLLVTDLGFLSEPRVVWETLGNVNGDSHFVDGEFHTVPPKPEPTPAGNANGGGSAADNTDLPVAPLPENATREQQEDHDYAVALHLADREEVQPSASPDSSADLELAKQLQEEEERRAAGAGDNATTSQQQSPTESDAGAKKKSSCLIL